MSRRSRRHHGGDCPSCAPPDPPKIAVIIKDPPPSGRTKNHEKTCWQSEMVAEAQQEDPDIGPVTTQLKQNRKKPESKELQSASRATREVWAQFDFLQMHDGVLYRQTEENRDNSRMVLSQKLVKEALEQLHNGLAGAHLGRMKTLLKMKARFWRPGLTKIVYRYCDNCLTCAKCNIDIVGPLPRSRKGNCFILTAQCSFSKWAEAYPISNQRATTCARVLVRNWICRFGVPDSLHSDQGRNFESKIFKELCDLLHINKTRSTAYHPEGNGQIENLHKTMKSMLKSQVDDKPESWDEHLDYCMMAYRSSVHSSTGHTSFELMFGREMRIPLDIMVGGAKDEDCSYSEFVGNLQEDLETSYRDVRNKLQRRQKDAYDKGIKHSTYQPGDLVLRYTPQLKIGEASKFHRQWEGPYEIVERVTEVTYRLRKVGSPSRRSSVVHFNNLRLYKRKEDEHLDESTKKKEDYAVEVGVKAKDCMMSAHEPNHTEDIERDSGYDSFFDATIPHQEAVGEKDIEQVPDTGGDSVGTAHVPEVESEGLVWEEETDVDVDVEQESDEEQPAGDPRPVRVRRPPDWYGDWVVNNLRHATKGLREDQEAGQRKGFEKLRPGCLRSIRQPVVNKDTVSLLSRLWHLI